MSDPSRPGVVTKSIASVLALIERTFQSMTPTNQTIAKYIV